MQDSSARQPDVTRLLNEWRNGQREALDAVVPIIYRELRRAARDQLSKERRPHTLQATDLVHEAFLRLVAQESKWQNRAHFYAIAATCMRRILVDHSRRKRAAKRPQIAGPIDIDILPSDETSLDTVLALDEALRRLETTNVRQARVAELRFFGDLDAAAIAEAMGISIGTVKRDLQKAKQTLQALLSGVMR